MTVQSRISLDSTHVYWMSENAGGVIWRVPKAGGSVREVVGDIGTPGAFALSDARIYWGDRAYLGSIFRAKVDGSNVEPFTGKWGGVDAMLVVGDTLYWNEQLSGGGTNLASIPVAGAAAPDTFVSVSDSFSWFTMADGCLFYYANGSGNTLMRSCGASPEPVYAAPEALDLAPHGSSDASYLYFGSDGEGVMRLSLTDASSPDLLAHGTKTRYVIVDSGTLYYVEGDPPDVPACTSYWGIYSIPKTGGTPTELVGPPTQCPSYLAADAEAIYWVDTDNGLLMRLAK